jgi:hypothetical protein
MSHPNPRILFAAALFLAATAVATAPADVVILKDGFTIQGNVIKETEQVTVQGQTVRIAKANGFDMIDEGPRVIIFSTHQKQLGEISKDAKIRPEYKAYQNLITARKSSHPLPAGGGFKSVTEFDAKWRRKLEIRLPGNIREEIEQQITHLDPHSCFVVSTTHIWRLTFRTSEMDPYKVRKLLSMHPELAEPGGKPDPLKRLAIARFMKDAGWLFMAKEEIDRLKKDHPGEMSKEAKDQLDKLTKEVEQAAAELVAAEAELALNAGRYRYAGELLAMFPDQVADPKAVVQATTARAQQKAAVEKYETARRRLGALIEEATGLRAVRPAVAAAGGPVAAVWPRPKADPMLARLAAAAVAVDAELHPDSVGRLEFFVSLTDQVERDRAEGREPSKKPEELLAAAVSGWVKGKAGTTPAPDQALRVWGAREMVLAFQRSTDLNTRNELLAAFKRQSQPPSLDELAQVISLLPPAEAEDLAARSGEPVPAGNGVPPGVYRRKTWPRGDVTTGIDYLLKLPPEYHHGRAYPVLIALTHPSVDPGQMIASLAHETDRHGYILVAPDWSGLFEKGWQWKGEDHVYVTEVLRDLIRHFAVDNDRVFLFGAGDGANMAMDVGMSHPDLFAGVLAMGPIPRWPNMFIHYWKNAQQLPFYVVTGELAPGAVDSLRRIYAEWMPRGYPSLWVVYKGRAIEWYAAEVPIMFDWMGRKRRATPAATLKLTGMARQAWQIGRPTDNRFFWLGADDIDPRRNIDTAAGRVVTPAYVIGDIRGANVIDVNPLGFRTLNLWLTADMIDWAKPVQVLQRGSPIIGWKPRVIQPDLEVLLEDYRLRGDRRMLFLAKLEFQLRDR